jgi:hypothetical protein
MSCALCEHLHHDRAANGATCREHEDRSGADEIVGRRATGYAFAGPAVELGALVVDGSRPSGGALYACRSP